MSLPEDPKQQPFPKGITCSVSINGPDGLETYHPEWQKRMTKPCGQSTIDLESPDAS